MITKTVTEYTRDEVYTYVEAAKVIAVSQFSLRDAAGMGTFTTVRLPHEMEKFIPKIEVDALAGLGQVKSKKVREILAQVRQQSVIDAHPDNKWMQQEMTSGEPIQEFEPQFRQMYTRDPSGFMMMLAKLLGGKIHVEYGDR